MKLILFCTIILSITFVQTKDEPKCKFDPYVFHCRNVNETEWVENIESAGTGLLKCTDCDLETLPIQDLKLSTRQRIKKLTLENITTTIRLDEKTFDDCYKLEDIKLQNVEIEELKPEYLRPLRDLEDFIMVNVRTKYLNTETFKYVPFLETLKINNGHLTSLNFDTMKHLVELEKLDVSSNAISEIAEDTFKNNNDLEKIYLYKNLLTSIQKNVFDHLRKLKVLDLSDNPLIEFDFKHIVSTHYKLKHFYLFDLPCTTFDNFNLVGRKCAVQGNAKKSIAAYNKMSDITHEVFGDKSKCDVLCYSPENLDGRADDDEYKIKYKKAVVELAHLDA